MESVLERLERIESRGLSMPQLAIDNGSQAHSWQVQPYQIQQN
jgi:hypothetical protein